MESYSALLSPFSIGGLHLKNRVVMAAMGNNLSHPEGTVSDRAIAYYRERAKGGTGLIITEACPVSLSGRHRGQSICIYHDSFVPGLQRLTKAIHEEGSAIAVQLHHAGRLGYTNISGGLPLAPSPIPRGPGFPAPKELTLEEIEEIVSQFGTAARRAQAAGFDAIEIHGAHGYLIHQFLSSRSNQRKDRYGGTAENRARFSLEVMRRVRRDVGDSYPIIFRISLQELVPGGYPIEEPLQWVLELEKAGVSAFHVSGGTTESLLGLARVIPPMEFSEAYHVHLAAEVKRRVKIPVIAVGRLGNPAVAEKVLQEGEADFVALGRPLLSDPFWAAKAARGEGGRIRPCIACNYCIWKLIQQEKITCLQNSRVGREEEHRIRPAEKSKRVLVLGGGVCGMEAARIARKRGHKVTLMEKAGVLGGQMLLAGIPPQKEDLGKAVKWLIQEIRLEGVEVKLNQEGDAKGVERERPDAVIVATGALPVKPESFSGPNVLTAWQVLSGAPTGKKVLMLGGGMVGAETAEHLRQKGCEVTIVEMLGKLAADMEATTREFLLDRISSQGISVLLSTKVEKVQDGRVLVKSGKEEKWMEADTIVLALGARPARDLLRELEEKVPEITAAGDCVEPRRAKEAIYEGFLAGLKV